MRMMPKEVVVDQGSAVCPARPSMCSKAAPQRAVSVSKCFHALLKGLVGGS